jgi:hypothetical protein
MLNSKVLTDDIFRREIKSLDRYEIALSVAMGNPLNLINSSGMLR